MNDIKKIAKSPEDAGLLIKDVSETIKNETKKQKGTFRLDQDFKYHLIL